jgi:exonuclease SbcC
MNLADQIRRVRGFDQLLVISHDDTFEQGLDSLVRLNKVNGETCLVVDEDGSVPQINMQLVAGSRV